jgi:hypothetical protein
MRVRVDDTESLGALIDFLERRACRAVPVADDVVAVELPEDLDAEAQLLELDLYLAVFRSTHPGADVQLVR